MKVKFKRNERIAGLFILIAIGGAIVLTGVAAIQKGWFQAKVDFKTKVISAEGLRPGAPVTISGIRAGEIDEIELLSADNIVVHFSLFEKFHKQIRKDSLVLISRPFVIGEKAIEVTVGSPDQEIMESGAFMEAQMAFDMMDIVSGKKIGPFLGSIEGLATNLSTLAQAFADPKRTQAFVKMFDRMDPLILSLGKMSNEVAKLAADVNVILPQMQKEAPDLGKQVAQLVNQMKIITTTLTPAFKEVGPDLPHVSRRAVEALDEMVVTLKAIQKSFLLSGKVQDVRQEERERKPSASDKD